MFNFLPDNLNLKERISPLLKDKLPIAPSPFDVIAQVSGMRLLRFRKPLSIAKDTLQTPLFIIPSMINRYYVLDLLPGKSFIEYLLASSMDVYLLDWGTPFDEDNWLTLDQLVTQRVNYFVDLVSQDSKKEKVNVFGHCLGGTLATMYSIRYPEHVNSLCLLTTPVDFEHGGKLGLWSKQTGFHPENITKAYGHMPWWVLQSSFQLLKPMLPWHKLEKLMKEFNNPEFMKNFWALEVWSQDNVSFPGLCFVTLIEELYRKNALIKGEMQISGQPLSLERIQSPVLNVAATDDHIVLFKSTMQNYHVNKDVSFTSLTSQGGHIGAILGSKAQKNIWPQIREWLTSHDMEKH